MILESSQLYPAFEVVVLMLNGTLVPQFGTLPTVLVLGITLTWIIYLFIYLLVHSFFCVNMCATNKT